MKYAIFLLLFLLACAGTVEVDTNDMEDTSMEDTEPTTYEDETVEVTTKVESDVVETEVNVEVEQDVMLDDCPVGETVKLDSGDGSVDAEIMGMTTFKGEEFCHGVTTNVIQDMEITSDYYFKGKTIWVVTEVMGQKTETLVELE